MSWIPRLALCIAALSPALSADVIVVDASGAGDFTSIAAAVTAANSGDTVLVRAGNYGDLDIIAKSLNVVAAPGADVNVTNIGIGNLSAQQSVVVSGIDASIPPTLIVINSDGPVWIQDCELRDNGSVNVYHGAEAHTSTNVFFQHCTLEGGSPSIDEDGGHGLLLFGNSRVAAWSTVMLSGRGGNQGISGVGNGGHGVHIKSGGTFYGMDCQFVGSLGGNGSPPGIDGVGALLAPAAIGRLTDSSATGAGTAADFQGGFQQLTANRRELIAAPVAYENTTAQWTVNGQPGDIVYVMRSRRQKHAFLASTSGVLGLRAPIRRGPALGTIGASGQLQVSIALPNLPAGEDSETRYYQLAVQTAGGSTVLGNPLALEILDSSF